MLEKRLIGYQFNCNYILNHNKEVVDLFAVDIENLILSTISKKSTSIERVSFLFDFVTNYLTYSVDYFQYCLQVPPINDSKLPVTLGFDFKNCFPVDSSINGMLVMGQGLCNDISNFISYLGRKLGLDINSVFATYKGNNHSFNSITLENGDCHFFDATRLIRGDMTKDKCFLVSIDKLNKENCYEFREDSIVAKDYKGALLDYQEEVVALIQEIRLLAPQLVDLNTGKVL